MRPDLAALGKWMVATNKRFATVHKNFLLEVAICDAPQAQ
jgi:hypothetical protein